MDELLYLQDLASIGHKNVQSEALFVDVIRCMRGSIRFRYPERTKNKSFLELRSKLCSHRNQQQVLHPEKFKIQTEKLQIHPEKIKNTTGENPNTSGGGEVARICGEVARICGEVARKNCEKGRRNCRNSYVQQRANFAGKIA